MKKFCIILSFLIFPVSGWAKSFDISLLELSSDLVQSEDFRSYTSNYFSVYKGAYFFDAPVHEQALVGLGGPPGRVKKMESGDYFVSGCRAHSCKEKVAYVADGEESLFGFISYFCPSSEGKLKYTEIGCLIIFPEVETLNEKLKRSLKSWAKSHLNHESNYVAKAM
uniref:hypothetical protein n=1 Tax=Microbulbifer agarilyticus TaxID=260552 RepID=UPI0002558675|nr:hypothetical protein [Microbulbifer agarilyticus]